MVGWMDILTFFDILLKPPQPFTGLFFLEKFTVLSDPIIYILKDESVCFCITSHHIQSISQTEDMSSVKIYTKVIYGITTGWMRPLGMKPMVSFYIIKHRQNLCNRGKLRENTGNFIFVGMWPPCLFLKW